MHTATKRQHLSFADISFGRLAALRDKLGPYPPPALADSVLNRMEQALLNDAADAFFPPDDSVPLSGSEAGVLRYFDDYIRRAAGAQPVLIHLLLLFIEASPLVFGPRLAPFTRLTPAERITFLDGAFGSRIYFRRVAFTSLRALMTMAYLANPKISDRIGVVVSADPFGLGDDAPQREQREQQEQA